MEDSTPIESILEEVNAQLPAPPASPGIMTQEVKPTMQGSRDGTAHATRALAKNMLMYILCFAVMLLISLPMFHDWVMSFIPRAVTASGTLSLTGAFFKALIGTGLFVGVQFLFIQH